MRLLATGSAAAALAPATALGAKASRKPAASTSTSGTPSRPPAMEKNIREQKASLAKQLQTLRAVKLPAGSDMAFVFKPTKRTR